MLGKGLPVICRVCAIPLRHMIGKPFLRHRTNPPAEVGSQSDALPLFSRCHLATSRLPCGVLVPPFFEKTGGEKTFKTMQSVSKCAKLSMPDKTLACTTIFPTRNFADVRCRQNSAGQENVLAYPWGAPRCGRRLSLPSLLAVMAPLPCRQSPSPLQPYRCPSSAECGNPRRNVCGRRFSTLPFRSRRCRPHTFLASHCGARLPSPAQRGSRFLRSRLPLLAINPRAPCA